MLHVRRHRAWMALLLIISLMISIWAAARYAERRDWRVQAAEGSSQLQLYAQSLGSLIERFSAVPQLLAMDSDIRHLLQHPEDAARRQQLNLRLERLNHASGASVLYLMDDQGLTLAASNWREYSSFVGNRYAFRPYFSDAVSQGSARYFAVGVTTGVPGYFLSHAVYDGQGRLLGVLAIKLELEALQHEWVTEHGILLVTDPHQVVILSNQPDWRFRTLAPMNESLRADLKRRRTYEGRSLQPLQPRRLADVAQGASVREVQGPDGTARYLWQQQPLASEGWTLHLLSPARQIGDSRAVFMLAAAGVWLALVFWLLFMQQRRKTQRLQRSIRARLEHQVARRTAELRQAQEGLVHAARMAALGQMSAVLAHEINQPLTALHMHLGTQQLLIGSGREDELREGLARMDALLQRMAALTRHLKTFARKAPAPAVGPLRLRDALEQAVQLLEPRLRAAQVSLRIAQDDPAWVDGDAVRLEQVLLNLLNNALDALNGRAEPLISVRIWQADNQSLLSVQDNGGGLSDEALRRVFEPFYTSKPVGQGLGLGLAVSQTIVAELGGRLTVQNIGAGACFTLHLPAKDAPNRHGEKHERCAGSR